MKTLFWKEFRENIKWSLIAAGCVLAAMFYALHSKPEYYNQDVWQTLCSPQFLLITTFGFPIIGAVLGFLQILTELRRDQWAFLVHRPVSHSQVFFGKAVPGICLYIIATLIPLFLVAWWASQPGSIAAPFDWRLTIPGSVDSLTGLGFYFAALWIGIQKGPWYARRSFPIIAACFIATFSKQYELLIALEGTILGVIALFLASWGAFITFGSHKNQTWWGKITSALVCLFLLAAIHSWIVMGWEMIFPGNPSIFTNYHITKQGQIVKVIQEGSWFKNVSTLEGRELKPKEGMAFGWNDFLYPTSLNLTAKPKTYREGYRNAERFFQLVSTNTPRTKWYSNWDRRQFFCYDSLSKRLIGCLGPTGFFETSNAIESSNSITQFEFPYRYETSSGSILIAPHAVYLPKFESNEIQALYNTPPGEILLDGSNCFRQSFMVGETSDYVIATNKKIEAYSEEGQKLCSYSPPSNIDLLPRLLFFRLKDQSRYFLLFQSDYEDEKQLDPLYVELAATGDVLKQEYIPAISRQRAYVLDAKNLSEAAISPFGQTIWEQISDCVNSMCGVGEYIPLWKAKTDERNYTLTLWTISIVVGVLCAVAMHRKLKSLPMSKGEYWAWIAFLVFYGIAGILVVLIVHDWPRRLLCPSCQKKRSIESATCEHCGAGWPAPALDGTEIFESDLLTAR